MITSNGRPEHACRMFDALADRVVVTVAEAREHAFDVDVGLGAQACTMPAMNVPCPAARSTIPDALGRRRVIVGFVLVIDDARGSVRQGSRKMTSIAAQQIGLARQRSNRRLRC